MQRRRTLVLVATVALLAVAGCSGISGQTTSSDTHAAADSTPTNGPSVLGPKEIVALGPGVYNGVPGLAIEYNATTYARVLLQAPDGTVVTSGDVGGGHDATWIAFADPRAGNYTVVLKQNGSVVSTDSIQLSRARPTLSNISIEWRGNTITTVTATISNPGEVPINVNKASVSVRNEQASVFLDKNWLQPNGSVRTTLYSSQSALYSNRLPPIETPGEVRVTATVSTEAAVLRATTQHTIQPPNFSILNVDPVWNGSTLKNVTVTVQNAGDIPSDVNVTIARRGGSVLASKPTGTVETGEQTTITVAGWYGLTTVTTPGKHTYTVTARHEYGAPSTQFSRSFKTPTVSITSIDPSWSGTKLTALTVTINKTGVVPAHVAFTLSKNETQVHRRNFTIAAAGTRTYTIESYYSAVATVEQPGRVRFNAVAHTNYSTASAHFSRTFEPASINITEIDPNWQAGVLRSIDARIVNRGDFATPLSNISVSINGQQVHTIKPMVTPTIKPNSITIKTFRRESLFGTYNGPIYTATAGGAMTTTLHLGNANTSDRMTTTESIGTLNAQISTIDVETFSPYGKNKTMLTSVDGTVQNTGELVFQIDAVRVTAGGKSQTVDRDPISTVAPGKERGFYVVLDSMTVADSVDTVTVELLYHNDVIAETTVQLGTS